MEDESYLADLAAALEYMAAGGYEMTEGEAAHSKHYGSGR